MSKVQTTSTVPKLRFPDFHKTSRWIKEPMGNLFEFLPNNSLSRDKLNYESGNIKNIHYGDIHTKFKTLFKIDDELVPFINKSESLEKYKPESYCREGDMIFADASEDLEDIGKSIELVQLKNEKILSGTHTILARPKENIFFIGFCGYLFKSNFIRAQIKSESQGAKVLGISGKKLAKLEILFPEKKQEQQKIAECFSSIDELITAQSKKVDALINYKKSLLQQLFPQNDDRIPQLRFPEFKKSGDWNEKLINSLFKFKQGVQIPVEIQFPSKAPDMVRFIRIIDVTSGGSEPARYIARPDESHLIKCNDLFMIRYGTPGLISIGYEGVIANNLFRLIWKDTSDFQSKFWFYAFQRIEKEIYDLSGSSSMPAISFSTLERLVIKAPKDVKEQQKIAEVLSSLDELITLQKKTLECFHIHKKGLLQQLFPSKIEGNDE